MGATNITENHHRSRLAQVDSVLLYGTFGLLMFGPVAFGAVEPWSLFVLESGTALLFVLWVGKQILDGELRIRWNPLFLPLSAFGLLIYLQIVFRTSVYQHDTVSSALLYCAYGMLCFLSGQTLLRSAQARNLALILCTYGFVLAAFALVQGISSNGRLYWLRQPRMGGWIYGPYVNHNHYAGLMELLIPIPLVLSLTHLAQRKQRIAAAIAAVIMATTIFLSGSRGGMFALVVELVVLGVFLVRQQTGIRFAVAGGAFLAVLIGLLTWLGGGLLAERVTSISTEAHTEISGGVRVSIDRDALQMFPKRPLLGWGLGTFPVVYPQFRSFYTNFFVNEAHDDYLQLLVEMGLLGFGTMVWFLTVLYRRVSRKMANWTSDLDGAVTLACILGSTGILVHSALDFNLQIPANAALFYVFCTLAASDPFMQPRRKRKRIRTETEELRPAPVSEVV